jgi:hypothetical protein
MKIVKLSELPEDTQLSLEESNTSYTAAKMKHEILELGEPHHLSKTWYTVKDATWTPSASGMIERLIEDAQDDMYEDWDERATDCVDDEVVAKMQVMLEEMFDSARGYWEYENQVEIDIFPHEAGEQT